jgi:hypothetical protein
VRIGSPGKSRKSHPSPRMSRDNSGFHTRLDIILYPKRAGKVASGTTARLILMPSRTRSTGQATLICPPRARQAFRSSPSESFDPPAQTAGTREFRECLQIDL